MGQAEHQLPVDALDRRAPLKLGKAGRRLSGSHMPEICRFLGIVIAMHYNDHSPPHFHARYGDYKALIAIQTGEVLAGQLPPRVLGLVQEWRELYKSELADDWRLAQNRKPLNRIEPLE